ENYKKRYRRNLSAAGIILTFVFIIYTAWYIAFFTILYMLFFAVSALLLFRLKTKRYCFSEGFQVFKANHPIDFVWYIALSAALIFPFFKIYLPALKYTGAVTTGEFTYYLPELIDFINVSEDNLVLGKVIGKLELSHRGLSPEQDIGISIITLILFFVCLAVSRKRNKESDKISNIPVYACGISVAVGMLFALKLNSGGISLWFIIYKVLPGAASLRAIARFVAFLVLPMTIFISVCLGREKLDNKTEKKAVFSQAAVVVLSALIFISDMRTTGVSASWNSDERLEVMSQIAEIPADAECFYVIDTSGNINEEHVNQLNALEISILNNVPSLNGYSGKMPPNWNLWNIYDSAYISNADDWIKRHNLSNVYMYDIGTNIWVKHNAEYSFEFDEQS
ncbi:MAG: hypothetical protein NC085_12915, partial [Muribaculaceae bacterium]|nr:hypothetical protein [Muribaculaceae bacterium]